MALYFIISACVAVLGVVLSCGYEVIYIVLGVVLACGYEVIVLLLLLLQGWSRGSPQL